MDIENDVIATCQDMAFDLRNYEVFDKDTFYVVLDKLLYLRAHEELKGKRIQQLNMVGRVDLPIKKEITTKVTLQSENKEVLTDSFEIHICSVEEAQKVDDDDKFVQWLKFFGAKTFEERQEIAKDNKILQEANEEMEKFIKSEEYLEAIKKEKAKKV